MPWAPSSPILRPMSPPDGVSDWQEEVAPGSGWPGPQQAQTSGGILPQKPGSAPTYRNQPAPSLTKGGGGSTAGASASVSMATPLPGQSRDSELPTATPWQPAPPEESPGRQAQRKLRPGENPRVP